LCNEIKKFCLKHEWVQSLFASLGVGLLVLSLWFILEAHALIINWIDQNVLAHGLMFVGVLLLDVLAILGLIALGFSECSEQDYHCMFAYRGRRTHLHPKTFSWLDSLGRNPRRRHHSV